MDEDDEVEEVEDERGQTRKRSRAAAGSEEDDDEDEDGGEASESEDDRCCHCVNQRSACWPIICPDIDSSSTFAMLSSQHTFAPNNFAMRAAR